MKYAFLGIPIGVMLALLIIFIAYHIDHHLALIPATPTHWVRADDPGCCEEYDRCVRDSDGRILVEVMHATNDASAPFGVFENGAGRGDYLTREQAKRAAGDVDRSCVIK